ncbi:YbaB/EbfC family nucleoid-associated protein [Nocardia tengchongensis]|uniref:YbaB/EbfC family nucleoid-associated protein n=1 Tax=Nocardia tengchongensis TaxID=2055889 RepID=UPI0036938721
MRTNPIGDLNKRILDAVTAVRGLAETSGGAVVVETDALGTITDLRLSPAAMAVDGERLAKAIMACQQTAKGRAEAEANRVYAELVGVPTASGETSEWEELRPTRVTDVR